LEPLLSTPEFQYPEGSLGVPEVLLWKLEYHSHSTSSPSSTVRNCGEKLFPLGPTWTENFFATALWLKQKRSAKARARTL
jgi:hypothetical protein